LFDMKPHEWNESDVKPGVLGRKRLKFRADGSVKIKGHAVLSRKAEDSHVFFEESDDEEPVANPDEEVEDITTAQDKYTRDVRNRLAAVDPLDKERDRERIHQKHLHGKRAKRREEGRDLSPESAPQLPDRGPDDDEDDIAELERRALPLLLQD